MYKETGELKKLLSRWLHSYKDHRWIINMSYQTNTMDAFDKWLHYNVNVLDIFYALTFKL